MSVCTIAECVKPFYARAMCKMHYERARVHGDPNYCDGARARRWLEENVAHTGDDCLKWPFSDAGYGSVSKDGKTTSASRYMCFLAHGAPPTPRHHSAHSCGNGRKGCVNPKHLSWKTPKENEADKLLHGTRARGSKINTAKLTERQVREIKNSSAGARPLARKYGVDHSTIALILRGKNWGWVEA